VRAQADGERLGWERGRVARARQGDRQAFAELYEAYAGTLYARVLLPKLGDERAAEDALSEAFREVLEHLDRFEDRGDGIWPWLVRIGTNKALDMHRVKSRTGRALASFEGLMEPLRRAPIDPADATEAKREQARVRGVVDRALAAVHARYRRAIELRYFEEREREDCARALGVTVATFDVVLLRALRAFRREWDAIVGPPEETP
jgi:RNA polymerase sigma-70 factor (ECF subfamily)